MIFPGMWFRSILLLMMFCVSLPLVSFAEEPSGAAVYRQKIEPLTTQECARCHYSVFTGIRDNGGQHQLECSFCHETYHTWKPGRPWSEVVPQCVSCHGEIHGPGFSECLACHSDPHAPLYSLVKMDVLGQSCGSCHTNQASEVKQFPSAHTEVACNECHHDRHGYLPGCLECHPEPHMPFSDNAGCLECHPVHSPLEIHYGEDIGNETCGACHETVQKKLRSGTKKHSQLYCVYCHADQHRYIPQCRDCHTQPHNEKLLQKFSGCAECHGDPHALKLGE